MAEAATAPDAARHVAFFYSDDRDYAAALGAFAAAGMAAGQPVFIAVPGPKIGPLRDALGGRAADVTFADMTEMGRNPAWIIPRVQSFIDASGGRHVRYVGEPIWAERTAAELREATKHEALINLAFGQAPASILCPYDSRRLSTAVLADAEHTHPAVRHGGQALDPSGTVTPSAGYRGPGELPAGLGGPLPPCPDDTESLTYRDELTTVRALVARQAGAAGLPRHRASDLVLCVSEIAANTIRHAGGTGTLRVWHDADEIVCQINDRGQIRDPLVGRLQPLPGTLGGHGLWIVHQACDLVELRSGRHGTTIRLHMRRPAPPAGEALSGQNS